MSCKRHIGSEWSKNPKYLCCRCWQGALLEFSVGIGPKIQNVYAVHVGKGFYLSCMDRAFSFMLQINKCRDCERESCKSINYALSVGCASHPVLSIVTLFSRCRCRMNTVQRPSSPSQHQPQPHKVLISKLQTIRLGVM